MRLPSTTYLYEDPGHPERVTGAVTSPPFIVEDHAMLRGLEQYEASLCPGCGIPRSIAWHSDMGGWYEDASVHVICQACTGRQAPDDKGQRHPVTYVLARSDRSPERGPLPPFVLGVTTESP